MKYKYQVVVFSHMKVLLAAAVKANPNHVAAGNKIFEAVEIEETKDNAVDAFLNQTGVTSQWLIDKCQQAGSFPFVYDGILFVPDFLRTNQMVGVVPVAKWMQYGCDFSNILWEAFHNKPTYCNIEEVSTDKTQKVNG